MEFLPEQHFVLLVYENHLLLHNNYILTQHISSCPTILYTFSITFEVPVHCFGSG